MTTKFDVEKIDGGNDFCLWCVKRCVPLCSIKSAQTQKSREALPTIMFDEENDELMEKMHNVIMLCLDNEVLSEVAKDDTIVKLWL